MNASNQGQSVLPFALLAVLSLVAIYDSRRPLSSLRPPQPALREVEGEEGGAVRVSQKIWSDPFSSDLFYDQANEGELLPPSVGGKKKRVLLLPIALPDENRARDREARTRRRYAIHLALSRAGYRANHPNAIYAVKLEVQEKDEAAKRDSRNEWIALEVFDVDWLSQTWYQSKLRIAGDEQETVQFENSQSDFATTYDHVVVLYLRKRFIDRSPIENFKKATAWVRGLPFLNEEGAAHSVDMRVIGPADSGQVSQLLRKLDEAVAEENDRPRLRKAGSFVSQVKEGGSTRNLESGQKPFYLFSPIATSDFETLNGQAHGGITWRGGYLPVETDVRIAREEVERLTGGRYVRTVHNDSAVFKSLIQELQLRGVVEKSEDLRHVALIVESDTRYGRAMAVNFLKGAEQVLPECREDTFASRMDGLRVFSYISGIDGDEKLGGSGGGSEDAAKSTDGIGDLIASDKLGWKDPVSHGYHQVDYIRRLAQEVERQSHKNPIRSIGILGADVYDKLLLMRALKPVLREVVFFTTDLDARLWYSSEVEFTRNLLVGSSYGLSFSEPIQKFAPPFRDTYQSSIFVSVLLATNTAFHPFEIDAYEPQLYEIGTRGPIFLGGGGLPENIKKLELAGDVQKAPLFAMDVRNYKNRIFLGLFITFLIVLGLTIAGKVASRRFVGEVDTSEKHTYYTGILALVSVLGLIVAVFVFITDNKRIEPFYLFDGVSSWLAFYSNIINMALAGCLCIYIETTRLHVLQRSIDQSVIDVCSETRVSPKEHSAFVRRLAEIGRQFPQRLMRREASVRKEFLELVRQFPILMKLGADHFFGSAFTSFLVLNGCAAAYGFLVVRVIEWNQLENLWPVFVCLIVLVAMACGCALSHDLNEAKGQTMRQIAKAMGERWHLKSILLPLLLFMILTLLWGLWSGFNFLPMRGEWLQTLYEITQLLQVTTMLSLLSYVMIEAIWVSTVTGMLCIRSRDGLHWDWRGFFQNKGFHGGEEAAEAAAKVNRGGETSRALAISSEYMLMENEPDELRSRERRLKLAAYCVSFTARLTVIPNRCLLFPFIVLFISFFGLHTDFEGWAWNENRLAISMVLFAACLIPTLIMRMSANRLRRRAVSTLSDEEAATLFRKRVSGKSGNAEDYLSWLKDIRQGAYAPLLSQPYVLAFLTPMGGLGSFALLKLFFSNVF